MATNNQYLTSTAALGWNVPQQPPYLNPPKSDWASISYNWRQVDSHDHTPGMGITVPKQEEIEVEHITGDGKSTTFTFPVSHNYPEVRVFDRTIEGEDEEKTITLTASKASISIIQGESITVAFIDPPARRGVVVLIK